MNQLQYETSPYLLQHAHNPVDWYAWKPEALERAKQEEKPILVSIGYSTCHWCHVMERESFEDERIARFMNEHFVNIKVDREERPDIDAIYMDACQAISGSGGWPLNCFLTPDGRPFFAGTYYPPQSAYNRPSWLQVLENIVDAFEHKRNIVEDQANRLTEMIGRSEQVFFKEALVENQDLVFTPVAVDNMFQSLKKNFDAQFGGFGGAPKFPGTMPMEFLLQYHYYTKNEAALQHLTFSLDKMIRGGIYDQLGGGFARYATDQAWLIPHFEKMLYDNALFVGLLSDVYRQTQNPLYKTTIEETLEFISREMTGPDGGFYSALDADSEGVEGKFYVWSWDEVNTILGEDAALFCEFYDVTISGNWEGHNILWRQKSLAQFAQEKGLELDAIQQQFQLSKQKLFEYRAKRIRPGLDDKMLLSWNALMITALAKAGAALNNRSYIDQAAEHMKFLLAHFKTDEHLALHHTYKDGHSQYAAFLDDYAYLIEALLELYSQLFDPTYLEQAQQYCSFVLEHFLDPESKLFYFTSAKQQDILLRKKELYDSATPSGNSTMLNNLLKLSILLDYPSYREHAIHLLVPLKESLERYPSSFSRWAAAFTGIVYPAHEIAIVGEKAMEFAKTIQAKYIPNKIIMASLSIVEDYPLLKGKSGGADTNIFLCKNYSCQLPVNTITDFDKLIKGQI